MTDQASQGISVKLTPGHRVQVDRAFTQSDFDRFAALSGDDNPIHVDPGFAARTKFGRTVAHGMLLYSAVCAVLESSLPGACQLSQSLKFPSPTYTGEKVTIALQVRENDPEKGLVTLDTWVIRPDGQHGLEGETRVLLPGRPRPEGEFLEGVDPPFGQSFKGLIPGQSASARRAFSRPDLDRYAELIGDPNSLSGADPDSHRGNSPGLSIPNGLLGGLFSYLLGTQLPGPGTMYLKQHLHFLKPAHVGQDLLAHVEISRIRADKGLINLNTTCSTPDSQKICLGEALVLASDIEGR